MCGIAGILKRKGASVDREQLEAMSAALAHRGPDGFGTYCKGPVGLAHRRLSIIDIDGGKQPMGTPDGDLWITFNGEIFNYLELREALVRKGHKFATRSDTEVLLRLYAEEGEGCVDQLNGQWAFAIWDARRKKLFLSRDRLGVRPLFYTQTADSFLFASEIKALLACPEVDRELDLQGLDQIFTFWVTLPPRTAFRNIAQIPPGHSLVVQDGRTRMWPYWRLEYPPQRDQEYGGEKKLAQELLDLLLDSTRIRLRSDVPVGAYLSGGLDSTLIAALTRILVGDRLRTFSVSFADSEFDESRYQKEASTYLHTMHSDVPCTAEDIGSVFREVVRFTEQPVLRSAPAPMYLLSHMVRSCGFKVVLTGEGADELLGGYDIFKEAKVRRFCARNPESSFRPLLLRRLYPYAGAIQRQPAAYLKQFFCVGREDLQSPFFSHLPRWRLTEKLKTFFSEEARAVLGSYSAVAELEQQLPPGYTEWDPFSQAEYLETAYLLPGYILSSQGDRMAMAHAVEGRYPFLDHRVVEFSTRLAPALKMKVLDQKHLLKLAGLGLIPEAIRQRYKQPYRAPDGKSFVNQTAQYARDLLQPDHIRRHAVFNPLAVTALLTKFQTGRASGVRDNMALMGILSTAILLQQFVELRTASDIGVTAQLPVAAA